MADSQARDDLTCQELRCALDEAIGSLPEKYRAPIVLCSLEHKTYDEAARELGCPRISLAKRLGRAKELLRRQLEKRGITLSAAALTTALADMAAASQLPAMLTIKTIKAAALVAAGKSVVGCVPAGAVALAEEAVAGILGMKGNMVLMVLVLSLAIGSAGWARYSALPGHFHSRGEAGVQAPVADNQPSGAKQGPSVRTDFYGDPLPDGALVRFGSARLRHDGAIRASDVSPDGKMLATAGDRQVIVWNLATGHALHRFPCAHGSPYSSGALTFSPDGTRLGYVRNHYFACTWDLPSAKEIRLERPHSPKDWKKGWSPMCQFVNRDEFLICTHEDVIIWSLKSGKEKTSFPMPTNLLAIASDGHTYMRLEKGTIIGDTQAGKEAEPLDYYDVRRNGGEDGVAFSPDSKTLAIVNGSREIVVLRVADRQVRATFPLPESAEHKTGMQETRKYWEYHLTFSADGKTLLLGTWGGVIHRWDVATGKEMPPLGKHFCAVAGVHAFPDGRTLVSTSRDGLIRRFNLQTGREETETTAYAGGTRAAYSPTGRLAAIGDDSGRLDLWEGQTGKLLCVLQKQGEPICRRLTFSRNGKQLAAADRTGSIRFWQVPSGQPGVVWQREPAKGEWFCLGLEFSPDGQLLCVNDYPRNIRVMEVATGRLLWRGQGSYGETFSPDGTTLAITPGGPHLAMLDARTARERVRVGMKTGISDGLGMFTYLAYSPDGRFLAVEQNGALMLCDGHTGTEKSRLEDNGGTHNIIRSEVLGKRAPNQIRTIAFSHDSRILASAGTDGAVYLWEALSGKEVLRLPAHQALVSNLSFSADGRAIFSYGDDGQGYLWNLVPKPATDGRLPLQKLWADLADTQAPKAYQAIGMLVAAPRESLPHLHENLKPVARADQAKIRQHIADLASDKFAVRETATKELAKVGDQVQVPIVEALIGDLSLETRRRLEQVLKNLPGAPSVGTLRTIRAIMVLERIGSADAQAVLATLAGGAPGARETEEAKASLERLKVRVSK